MTGKVKLTKKQQDIVALAKKRGNSADLLLLDKLYSLEDDLNSLRQSVPEIFKAIQTIKGRDGDKGTDGNQGIQGARGEKGDKGDPGQNGTNGRDGIDGLDGSDGQDGVDGKDGADADMQALHDHIESVRGNLVGGIDEQVKKLTGQTYPPTGFFGGRKTQVLLIDISSLLNGSTKKFSIGTTSSQGIIGIYSSSIPFIFRPIIDYTLSGQYVTFDTGIDAPSMLAAGQSIIIQILK